jgi:hypothetical protein
MTNSSIRCSSCGAELGGRDGCQAVFDELIAKAWESPVRASVHTLVVDAYAMQHTEEYGKSAKSYVAHLVGLCSGIEAPGERDLYWAIPRWLEGPARVTRPPDLEARGGVTISDVRAPANEADYPELVKRWAQAVWAAYDDQHAAARAWLAAVRTEILRRA